MDLKNKYELILVLIFKNQYNIFNLLFYFLFSKLCILDYIHTYLISYTSKIKIIL